MKNLPQSLEKLSALVLGLQTRVEQLEKDNQVLKGNNVTLKKENKQLRKDIKDLEFKLLKKKSKPPFHPKANVVRDQEGQEEAADTSKKQRKLRVKAYTRKRSTPTHRVVHASSHCEACGESVSGQSVAWTREIIDLPVIKPTVTEHMVIKRSCWSCGHVNTPSVDLSHLTLGQSRIGVNLVSTVVTLKERFRLPIRMIQQYLKVFCQLDLSTGEIVSLLQRTANKGQPAYQQLKIKLRSSSTVHGDETGWRESGINGYIWGFNTPTIRYFVYRKSRGSQVVTEVLGDEFEGVLVSDFYASYNIHHGQHQRCWAHLLRDLNDLVKWFPDHQELPSLLETINGLFDTGKQYQADTLESRQRQQQRRELETKLLELITPYLSKKKHPFHTLAKRMDYFLDELFVFVLNKDIPATNNSAERALRHSVIARKISGGTRSAKGSKTKEILSSLFGTWDTKDLNPLKECRELLTNPNYAI